MMNTRFLPSFVVLFLAVTASAVAQVDVERLRRTSRDLEGQFEAQVRAAIDQLRNCMAALRAAGPSDCRSALLANGFPDRDLDQMLQDGNIREADPRALLGINGGTIHDGISGYDRARDTIYLNPTNRHAGNPCRFAKTIFHEWLHATEQVTATSGPMLELQRALLEADAHARAAKFLQCCCDFAASSGPVKDELALAERYQDQANGLMRNRSEVEPIGLGGSGSTFAIRATTPGVLIGRRDSDLVDQDEFRLGMSDAFDLEVNPWARAGDSMLVVPGMAQSGEGIVEFVLVDAQAGRVVGSAGSFLLGFSIAPIGVAVAPNNSVDRAMYVLVRSTTMNGVAAILRMTDADGDDIPDVATSTVWATSAAFPILATAETIIWTRAGEIQVSANATSSILDSDTVSVLSDGDAVPGADSIDLVRP